MCPAHSGAFLGARPVETQDREQGSGEPIQARVTVEIQLTKDAVDRPQGMTERSSRPDVVNPIASCNRSELERHGIRDQFEYQKVGFVGIGDQAREERCQSGRGRLSSAELVERRFATERRRASIRRVVRLLDQVAPALGPFDPQVPIAPRDAADGQGPIDDPIEIDQAPLEEPWSDTVDVEHRGRSHESVILVLTVGESIRADTRVEMIGQRRPRRDR